MTGAIPTVYRKAPAAIASYNYTDIAEGTGIVQFYGFAVASGASFLLGTAQVYSTPIESNNIALTPGDMVDKDFDLTAFNTARTISGDGFISMSSAGTQTGGTGVRFNNVIIRKWDGTTETDLVTVSGALYGFVNDSRKTETLKFTVPTTVYKSGEQLRVTVQVVTHTAATNGNVFLAHDPQGRNGPTFIPASDGSDTTKLEVFIPFRIID